MYQHSFSHIPYDYGIRLSDQILSYCTRLWHLCLWPHCRFPYNCGTCLSFHILSHSIRVWYLSLWPHSLTFQTIIVRVSLTTFCQIPDDYGTCLSDNILSHSGRLWYLSLRLHSFTFQKSAFFTTTVYMNWCNLYRNQTYFANIISGKVLQ